MKRLNITELVKLVENEKIIEEAIIEDASITSNIKFENIKFKHCRFTTIRSNNIIFKNCEFKNIAFSNCTLIASNFQNCIFKWSSFNNCNLRKINFTGSKFDQFSIYDSNTFGINLSNTFGLLKQSKFLNKFKKTNDGIICYKTFNCSYKSNQNWKIEENSIIEEEVDFDRWNNCGCGINVATKKWVKYFARTSHVDGLLYKKLDIWKCLIPNDATPTIVVPYNSDGKFRVGKLKLLKKVK